MKTGIVAVVAIAAVAIVMLKKDGPTDPQAKAALSPPQEAVSSQPIQTVPMPRLVDLGAGKCIPCKMMEPVLEELRTEYAGRLTVDFYDVWKEREIGKQYGVSVIPTQIFYDATGKELFRHQGFMSKQDILAKWTELGIDLGSPVGKGGAGFKGTKHD